jgi:hypothetical protein
VKRLWPRVSVRADAAPLSETHRVEIIDNGRKSAPITLLSGDQILITAAGPYLDTTAGRLGIAEKQLASVKRELDDARRELATAEARLERIKTLRRIVWWLQTRGCDCHWQEPYGEVVAMGCELHD